YGPNGGLPTMHLDAIAAGNPVTTRWDPCPYSPTHQDDINTQSAALLDAASVPATIVNWAADEAVSVQEWARYMGELTGTVADEVDDHVAVGEAPVDGAAELVAVAPGDDRLERDRVGLLEHCEVRTAGRELARVVDFDDEVRRDVLGTRRAVLVTTRAVHVH